VRRHGILRIIASVDTGESQTQTPAKTQKSHFMRSAVSL